MDQEHFPVRNNWKVLETERNGNLVRSFFQNFVNTEILVPQSDSKQGENEP